MTGGCWTEGAGVDGDAPDDDAPRRAPQPSQKRNPASTRRPQFGQMVPEGAADGLGLALVGRFTLSEDSEFEERSFIAEGSSGTHLTGV